MRNTLLLLSLIFSTLAYAGDKTTGNLIVVGGGIGVGASGSAYVTTPRTTDFIISGNIGIGSAVPGKALDVQGSVRLVGIKSSSGIRYVCVTTDGTLVSSASACSGT